MCDTFDIFDGSVFNYLKYHTSNINLSNVVKLGDTLDTFYRDYTYLCNKHDILIRYPTKKQFLVRIKKHFDKKMNKILEQYELLDYDTECDLMDKCEQKFIKKKKKIIIKDIFVKNINCFSLPSLKTPSNLILKNIDENIFTPLTNQFNNKMIIENNNDIKNVECNQDNIENNNDIKNVECNEDNIENINDIKSIEELIEDKERFILMIKNKNEMAQTEHLFNYIKNNSQMRIVYVSCIKNFSSKKIEKLQELGFVSYLEENISIMKNNRIICHIDFIWNLRGHHDLFILDGYTNICHQLFEKCADLDISEPYHNIEYFQEKILRCNKVYIYDELLKDIDVKYINELNNITKDHSEADFDINNVKYPNILNLCLDCYCKFRKEIIIYQNL